MKHLTKILTFMLMFSSLLTKANQKPIFQLTDAPAEKLSSKTASIDATYMTLDKVALQEMYENGEEEIVIQIPQLAKAPIEVTLYKKQILSDNFYLSTKNINGRTVEDYTPGNYYQNISNNQFAAISIFESSQSDLCIFRRK